MLVQQREMGRREEQVARGCLHCFGAAVGREANSAFLLPSPSPEYLHAASPSWGESSVD